MALTRMLGSAVRHPLAAAALGVGLAKGGVEVARRLVHPGTHDSAPAPEAAPEAAASTAPETAPESPSGPPEPEVVLAPVPEPDELAEPVVIHADDQAPAEPAPAADLQAEDELVWTSESTTQPEPPQQ